VAALLPWYFTPSLSDSQQRIVEYRRLYQEANSDARSELERKMAIYEHRMFEHALRFGTITALVRPHDGIDEFEALVLAKAYVPMHVGLCVYVGIPELREDMWTLAFATGREARKEPSILVHRFTGAITCGHYPSVADAMALLRAYEQWPNKAPEPTP
jgi:hypothetical protein